MKEKLPAIIPQVYLHYDPYTIREQPNGSPLVRQRMDFLLLLPHRQRVVIEIDGKQHYADGDKASPQRYATMAADKSRPANSGQAALTALGALHGYACRLSGARFSQASSAPFSPLLQTPPARVSRRCRQPVASRCPFSRRNHSAPFPMP